MKTIAIIFFTVLTTVFVAAADATNITAIIKGKRVEFSSDRRAQAVQKSVELLASCAYMNAKPKWGAGGSEPSSIADARKQSHLHLVFANPTQVEVPIEKVTLKVREMVISLPLATGGVWVRTDDGLLYFAMFDHTISENLQKVLDEALKP
ncbi:MAG: hypothetical protein QM813_22675 [Verrucomicrobiota bacterium]